MLLTTVNVFVFLAFSKVLFQKRDAWVHNGDVFMTDGPLKGAAFGIVNKNSLLLIL